MLRRAGLTVIAVVALAPAVASGGVAASTLHADSPATSHLGAVRVGPSTGAADAMTDGSRAATKTPNVVLMIVDDATVEDIRYMPHLQDLLVDQGTTFTRNYAPFPLCCPARATILTGQYPHNHHVLDNVAPLGGAQAFDPSHTIATYLTDDYDTALIGKYLNVYNRLAVPPGWDKWRVPVQSTTYNYLDQTMSYHGRLRTFNDTYMTSHYTQSAADFITNARRPYFAYVSWVAPHDGGPHEVVGEPPSPYVADQYRGTYTGPPLPADRSFNEADISDKRPSFQDHRVIGPAAIARISDRLAQRREALRTVDDGVAQIVDTVAGEGELDNTYFIFVSDNGQMQGEHRITRGKAVAYEPSARVPLVIRGPGIPAGGTYDQVTGLQDLTPTILSMTRQWHDQREAQIDGMSLLPLLRGTRTDDRAQVLEVAESSSIKDTVADQGVTPSPRRARELASLRWRMRGIVTNSGWKYVAYPTTGEVEMYDLDTDPNELHNLAGDPAFALQQEQLRQLYLRYRACDGAGCH